jgi:uncharacterized protein
MTGPSTSARWLVLDDRVLATLEVADSRRARGRGLLGRDGIEGVLLLEPARSVHTLGMRFAIDVAHLDADRQVLKVTTMVPNRIGLPVWRSKAILECEAGALARWGVGVGDRVELR